MDTLSPDAQATLLLTAHLGGASREGRPLTPTEWGRFAAWLRERGLRPGSLLADGGPELLEGWGDERLPRARLQELLGRGTALALSVESWQRAGLWVMTRSDPDYPKRLKECLGASSPAVLFGCGERALLSLPAVAVVGSRRAGAADLAYATTLATQLTRAGYTLVSGGARGVDEAGMLGAVQAGGSAVGVLPDSLLKAAVARKWRAALRRGALVLVSPFHPEAGFSIGNAMGRNRYVYCLALAAVVVHSGTSGGTWNGAIENLERGWVPLWVRPTHDPDSGGAGLVERGGMWLPEPLSEAVVRGLVSRAEPPSSPPTEAGAAETGTSSAEAGGPPAQPQTSLAEPAPSPRVVSWTGQMLAELSLYEVFRLRLEQILAGGARQPKELAALTGLTPSQLKAWLQRSTADGLLIRRTRPERYELARSRPDTQLAMFDAD